MSGGGQVVGFLAEIKSCERLEMFSVESAYHQPKTVRQQGDDKWFSIEFVMFSRGFFTLSV